MYSNGVVMVICISSDATYCHSWWSMRGWNCWMLSHSLHTGSRITICWELTLKFRRGILLPSIALLLTLHRLVLLVLDLYQTRTWASYLLSQPPCHPRLTLASSTWQWLQCYCMVVLQLWSLSYFQLSIPLETLVTCPANVTRTFEWPSRISTCLSTSFLSSCSLKIVSHSDNKLWDASLPNTLWSPPEVLQPQPRHSTFSGDAIAKLAQKYYQEQWLLVLSMHELSRVIVSHTRAYIRYGLHKLCYSWL